MRVTAFLGVDKDWWLIILTAIGVIGTIILVWLSWRSLKRTKQETDSNLLIGLLEKALEKIPTPLDANQPLIIASEKIKELEEKINVISQKGIRLNAELLVELGNV